MYVTFYLRIIWTKYYRVISIVWSFLSFTQVVSCHRICNILSLTEESSILEWGSQLLKLSKMFRVLEKWFWIVWRDSCKYFLRIFFLNKYIINVITIFYRISIFKIISKISAFYIYFYITSFSRLPTNGFFFRKIVHNFTRISL